MSRNRISKGCHLVVIICLGICVPTRLFTQLPIGQPVFEIYSVKPDKRLGALSISINSNIDIREKDLVGVEKIGFASLHALKYEKVDPRYRPKVDKDSEKAEDIAVLFLVDAGTGMTPYLESIRTGIKRALRDGNRCSFFVSGYTNDLHELSALPMIQADTVLNRSLKEGKSTASQLPNTLTSVLIDYDTFPQPKKVIIVLSNQPAEQEIHKREFEQTLGRVREQLKKSHTNYLIYGVGLGSSADMGTFHSLAEATPSPADAAILLPATAIADTLAGTLSTILKNSIPRLKTFYFKPEKYIYVGENRDLSLIYRQRDIELTANKAYRAGSFIAPVFLGANTKSLLFWMGLLVIGSVFVFALFVLLSLFVPYFNRLDFRRKYVMPYVRQGNKTETDPVTGDPIQEGDLVVNKCAQLIPLAIWEALGRCPNHPECTSSMGCNGAGQKEVIQGNFFSQKGILKKLNWLFFGAVGGYLAWTAYAMYQFTDMSSYQTLVNKLFTSMESNITGDKLAELQLTGFIGLSIGAILSVTLAYVEEVGQSRKFSLLRILGKFFLGVFFSVLTLLLGSKLQLEINNYFISGLITWMLFGLSFGLILSIGSGIQFFRAFLGGVLASVIAFLFYFLGVIAVQNLYVGTGPTMQYLVDFIKMTSFIVLGGVLGYGIVSIVSRLEDFELEYVAPKEVSGMVAPISKWLKAGVDVAIGTSSKCYVYVKWNDPAVAGIHAVITYSDRQVFIEPFAETLVNRVIIPMKKKTPLQANDQIRLGRDSTTIFRVIIKSRAKQNETTVPLQTDTEGKGTPPQTEFKKH